MIDGRILPLTVLGYFPSDVGLSQLAIRYNVKYLVYLFRLLNFPESFDF